MSNAMAGEEISNWKPLEALVGLQRQHQIELSSTGGVFIQCDPLEEDYGGKDWHFEKSKAGDQSYMDHGFYRLVLKRAPEELGKEDGTVLWRVLDDFALTYSYFAQFPLSVNPLRMFRGTHGAFQMSRFINYVPREQPKDFLDWMAAHGSLDDRLRSMLVLFRSSLGLPPKQRIPLLASILEAAAPSPVADELFEKLIDSLEPHIKAFSAQLTSQDDQNRINNWASFSRKESKTQTLTRFIVSLVGEGHEAQARAAIRLRGRLLHQPGDDVSPDELNEAEAILLDAVQVALHDLLTTHRENYQGG